MLRTIRVVLVALLVTTPTLFAQGASSPAELDLAGTWQGATGIGAGDGKLLKVSRAEGKYKAVLYSVDQGWQMTVNAFEVQGTRVTFAITGLNLTYTGTLAAPVTQSRAS